MSTKKLASAALAGLLAATMVTSSASAGEGNPSPKQLKNAAALKSLGKIKYVCKAVGKIKILCKHISCKEPVACQTVTGGIKQR